MKQTEDFDVKSPCHLYKVILKSHRCVNLTKILSRLLLFIYLSGLDIILANLTRTGFLPSVRGRAAHTIYAYYPRSLS